MVIDVRRSSAPQPGVNVRPDPAAVNRPEYAVDTGRAGDIDNSRIRWIDGDPGDIPSLAPHEVGWRHIRKHRGAAIVASPIRWRSPNHIDPTSTAFLVSVLVGARRFAHASQLRGDRALHARVAEPPPRTRSFPEIKQKTANPPNGVTARCASRRLNRPSDNSAVISRGTGLSVAFDSMPLVSNATDKPVPREIT